MFNLANACMPYHVHVPTKCRRSDLMKNIFLLYNLLCVQRVHAESRFIVSYVDHIGNDTCFFDLKVLYMIAIFNDRLTVNKMIN